MMDGSLLLIVDALLLMGTALAVVLFFVRDVRNERRELKAKRRRDDERS